MSVQGRVRVVDLVHAGNETVNPQIVGDTVLELQDVYDFDEDGGTVTIAGVNYAYTTKDDDASTITLAAPGLTAAIDAETAVDLYPVAQTKVALVDLEEEEEGVLAHIPYNIQQQFTDEIRDPEDQESVLLDYTGNAWVIIDVIGEIPLIGGEYVDTSTMPPPPTSDGNPPAASPNVDVIGGIGVLFGRWTAISNNDPVTYEVHLSTDAGFLPVQGDATTLVSETAATQVSVRTLPDGTALAYDTDYTMRVIAKDVDGAAAPGAADTDQLHKVDTPDVSAGFVYAGTILVDQLISGTLNSEVTLSGTIKTALSGARLEITNTGAVWYDSNGIPVISMPTDISPSNPASFKGEVEALSATITGGLTVRGANNEFSRGAQVELQSNTTPSQTPPSVVMDYSTLKLDLGGIWYGGKFIGGLQWDSANGYWLAGYQTSNGSAYMMRFNSDGSYHDYIGHIMDGSSAYTIMQACRVDTGVGVSTNANFFLLQWSDGSWQIQRVLDSSGSKYGWGVSTVGGHPCMLFTDNDKIFTVQLDDTNANVYRVNEWDKDTYPNASPRIYSFTGVDHVNPQAAYHGPADSGLADCFFISEHGADRNVTSIVPTKDANSNVTGGSPNAKYEWPNAANTQGLGWDGTHFWALADDGTMYRYEGGGNYWINAEVTTWWAGFTWKDSNTAGTITGGADAQHETALSALKQFTMLKRSRVNVTTPGIPYAGNTDDPNAVRIWLGRLATTPSYTQMYYQGTPPADPANAAITQTSLIITSAIFSGTTAPDPSNLPQPFPASSPAAVYSSALRLDGQPKNRIAGDGTARLDGLIPPGSVIMTVAAAAPTGWLLCQGQAVSRTTYADLFNTIGTQYGAGDGSTTFNLPDMQLRLPLGAWASSGVFALGMVDAHSSMTARSDSHSHVHSHTIPGQPAGGTYRASGSGGYNVVSQTLFEGHSHGGATSGDIGLSNQEQSAHAYTALNYLIKY